MLDQIILFTENDTDSLLAIYHSFPADLKESNLGREINNELTKRKSLLIGNVLPDVLFTASDQQRYSLSSFRNKKYVLLCFWASWCTPCKKGFPALTRLAEEYKAADLQLIFISIDENKDNWQAALRQQKLPGLQVCDLLPYLAKDDTFRTLYNIRYIPQYFLIDKEGKLIYHNNQMDDNVEEYPVLQATLKYIFPD